MAAASCLRDDISIYTSYCATMRPRIDIKPAHDDQAEAIGQLVRNAIRDINAQDYPAQEIERLVGNFTTSDILRFLKDRFTVVATQNGTVVGTGALQGDQIRTVFVSPDHQRQGIGRAVMRALEGMAAQGGVAELVVSSSLSAVRFYTALGYVAQRKTFYGAEETVVMTKVLRKPTRRPG